MSSAVMQQALAALVEALEIAGSDLAGVARECCGNDISRKGNIPPECCGDGIDAEDRVKLAIDALQKALGLQGATA